MYWTLYAIFLLLALYFVYRHRFFRLPGFTQVTPVLFFLLKLVAGLAIWYVYTFYYPERQYADVWKYYDDSEIMHAALKDHPGDYFSMISGIGIDDHIDSVYFRKMNHWHQKFENNLFNDSHTIIRFNAIARLFSAGNYHTHSLFMCFLAFIGLCALYRWIYPVLFQWKRVVAFILFISPSLLFWSSGVLKEGILFFSLGLLIYHTWNYSDDRKLYRLWIILLAIFLMAITKLYMIALVVPPLLLGVWIKKSPGFARLKVAAVVLAMLGGSLLVHYTFPLFSPYRIIAMKQNDFLNLARGGTYIFNETVVCYLRPDQRKNLVAVDSSTFRIANGTDYYYWKIADNFSDTVFVTNSNDTSRYSILSETPVAGSLLDVQPVAPDPGSVLAGIPAAWARTTVRPWPWEFKPLMVVPSIAENFLMFFLLILMLLYYKKTSSKPVLWFCLAYAFLTLAVIGLTTPVLGAIVRYRITAIPFLLFAILLCTDKEKLLKRVPFLGKLL